MWYYCGGLLRASVVFLSLAQTTLPPLPQLALATYPAAAREAISRAHRDAAMQSTKAETVGALADQGWSCHVGRYEVVGEKDCDRARAMADFLRAGLDPVTLDLHEVKEGQAALPGDG